MAEAAKAALGVQSLHVVADAGYSHGQQVADCEAAGIVAHAPTARTVNTSSGGLLFTSSSFRYQAETDTCLCPADKMLLRKAVREKDKYTVYAAAASDRGRCALKSQCTNSVRRTVTRHLYEEALERMQARVTPALMRLRRSTVEHPFATIKYHIFGHPRFLLRGRNGARTEIGLAVMAYNLKRMTNVLGALKLTQELQTNLS